MEILVNPTNSCTLISTCSDVHEPRPYVSPHIWSDSEEVVGDQAEGHDDREGNEVHKPG